MKSKLRHHQRVQFAPFSILLFAILFVLLLGLACKTPTTESSNKTQVALNVQATRLAQSETQTAQAEAEAKQQKEISDQQATLDAQATKDAQADAEQVQAAEEAPVEAESAPGAETAPAEAPPPTDAAYPIVDTGQVYCYENGGGIPCPTEGQPFYGQDAQYSGNAPSYTDNGDGTISDNVTGLMWQQDPGDKMGYVQAVAGAESFNLAGYDDWRLPTIKELYSLILFSGYDVSGWNGTDTSGLIPFIDEVFAFEYGDTNSGERIIDSQWATSSVYTGTVFGGQEAMFGVNFADGRIKGYPTGSGGGPSKTYFVIYVRDNPEYGINDFVNNGDGTIGDNATGLVWMQSDSGNALDWEGALNYCESLDFAGISDWRLPNVKELQSIVDYSRAPDTTNSAAIDPLFNVTSITNEAGATDYPFYWSSTTHANMQSGGSASYVSFGRALGYMNGQWMDVHGAGAQRSDPKSGDPSEWPTGRGPQGDAIRIYNYVRCVIGGVSSEVVTGGEADPNIGAGLGELPDLDKGPGQVPGVQPPPSPEAIDACTSLSAGAACSFNTPIGSASGSCTQIAVPNLTVLACVPEIGLP